MRGRIMAQTRTLELLSAGALEGWLGKVIPDFTRETRQPINLQVGTIGVVQEKLRAGQHADLVILSPVTIAAMDGQGRILKASATNVCQAEAGIGMPAGAALPDISTPEAFSRTLVAARAITATDPTAGGTAGVHFAKLLERMGIADSLKAKLILWNTGRAVIDTIATGKAELGVTFISELMLDTRIAVVGPLPPTMRLTNTYTAAVPITSGAVETARAFIHYLTGAAARARLEALGLSPASPF
jgi:molybdate transport system substrate-binding protein